jgi:hypothetical protein
MKFLSLLLCTAFLLISCSEEKIIQVPAGTEISVKLINISDDMLLVPEKISGNFNIQDTQLILNECALSVNSNRVYNKDLVATSLLSCTRKQDPYELNGILAGLGNSVTLGMTFNITVTEDTAFHF